MTFTFTFTDALIIAAEAHRGKKDQGGIDYIKHPMHLSVKLKQKGHSNETQMAALLHDVIEDTNITLEDLEANGCPESVLEALVHLTHVRDQEYVKKMKNHYVEECDMPAKEANARAKDEEYFCYVHRLSKNDIARAVKIEDLRHNGDIRRAPDDVYENRYTWNRWAKYAKALKILTGGKVGYV